MRCISSLLYGSRKTLRNTLRITVPTQQFSCSPCGWNGLFRPNVCGALNSNFRMWRAKIRLSLLNSNVKIFRHNQKRGIEDSIWRKLKTTLQMHRFLDCRRINVILVYCYDTIKAGVVHVSYSPTGYLGSHAQFVAMDSKGRNRV